jgi:hypothetical protein
MAQKDVNQQSRENYENTVDLNHFIPTNLLVSVGTMALITGLISLRLGQRFMTELGTTSEELLRGDRLPNLRFPISGG